MREEIIRSRSPRLRDLHFRITSPTDSRYNCFAWAVGDPTAPWLPEGPAEAFRWPAAAPRESTLRAWKLALATFGYEPCADGSLEPGYEKVAVYTLNGAPRHIARQLSSGFWTSKLGTMEDIEHDLEGLVGDRYGSATVFLRRPVEPWKWSAQSTERSG